MQDTGHKIRVNSKRLFTPEEEKFIRSNYDSMTNQELADAIGWKLTSFRTRVYELGYKRMELEYWTDEQVDFLRQNYRTIGDVEIAEIFQDRWTKQKNWSKKHIEKKRRYLKLKRTKQEVKAIHQRNVDQGRFLICPVKRWETTGQAAEGEIRFWREQSGRMVPRIKINGRFIHYARYRWEQMHGPVPDKMNVVFLDDNPQNIKDSNFGLLTNAELSQRNAKKSIGALSDNYIAGILSFNDKDLREIIKKSHPELIELKRTQLLLQRQINESI